MTQPTIRVAGASGFWGDSAKATRQLLEVPDLDYIVYDYLAEITMSIMARARAKDPAQGYARDFISAAVVPNLQTISDRGVKVISNAGGVNPEACAAALRAAIAEKGFDLKVACIIGDDLLPYIETLGESGLAEMFTGDDFPDSERVLSANAYLGAFPVAAALSAGADIVVTGRCVDSAVTLGACLYAFGWESDDWDRLAMGSLAGHILECGPQATGGNFTDWEAAGNIANIGYPVAEIEASGVFTCFKTEGTAGLVSRGTIAEQMLYEIGDPQAYLLPDVSCDFSQVVIEEVGEDLVRVSGALGRPRPDSLKLCVTYADQFRGGTYMSFYGIDAAKKAEAMSEAIFCAARASFGQLGMPDFSETSVEIMGAGSQLGVSAPEDAPLEVVMKIAAKHPMAQGIGVMLREATGLGLATPPGLSGFAGSRPSPSPVVRLFSGLVAREEVSVAVELDGEPVVYTEPTPDLAGVASIDVHDAPAHDTLEDTVPVPLIKLAWGRSGDKGNKANIGIIARKPEYYPILCQALTADGVAQRFAHFLGSGEAGAVQRFQLPGSHAINFLLDNVLGGGGVASLRNDPQGKGFAQLLLLATVDIPVSMAEGM